MKMSCNRQALSDAFQLICGVIDENSAKPVLRTVKVETQGESVKLFATDLSIGMVMTLPGVVTKEPGVVLVHGQDANRILKEMVDQTVEWSLEGNICRISGADSDFRLPTENPEEFPSIPEFSGTPSVEVARADLDVMIRRTVFSVSQEQMRYALNGILFVPGKGALELVATDGRRLAYTKRSAKCETASKGVIVPTKAVHELQKLLGDGSESIALRIEESRIYARANHSSMFAQLVEGQFPQYSEVIPKENEIKIVFKSEDLLSAVSRAALVTSPQSCSIRMHFEKDNVRFTAQSAEHGQAKSDLKVKYDAAPLDICFNPVFIQEMLRVVPEQEVWLEMKDGDSPALLRCADDYLYVVMPISLQQE